MLYRLIEAIDVPMTLNLVKTGKSGGQVYRRMTLQPHTWYDTEGDMMLEKSLMETKTKRAYTPELERTLKETGADYEITRCRSCGGKVTKISFYVVEVNDESA